MVRSPRKDCAGLGACLPLPEALQLPEPLPCFRNPPPSSFRCHIAQECPKPCALAPLSALLPPQEAFLKNPGLIMAAGSCFHMALGRLHVRPAADGYSCLNTACAITWISLCGSGRLEGCLQDVYILGMVGVSLSQETEEAITYSSTLSHGPTLLHKAAWALS